MCSMISTPQMNEQSKRLCEILAPLENGAMKNATQNMRIEWLQQIVCMKMG